MAVDRAQGAGPSSGSTSGGPAPPRRMPPTRRKLLFATAVFAGFVLALEIAARVFLSASYGLSLFAPKVLARFYPPVIEVLAQAPRRGDDRFDVLLLGASVLHEAYGSIEPRLERALAAAGHDVVIHNVSLPAQSSRDSLLKYELLRDQRFDLVVVYHAINDARTNNCPEEMYRDDYRHMDWYVLVQDPIHASPGPSMLVYLVRHFALKARLRMEADRYLPREALPASWLAHGAELKSVDPFRENLRQILELARERGDPVLLATYAIDPAHPEYAAWGTRPNLVAAVRAHNDVVRVLADEYDVALADQAVSMPRGDLYYDDICHLSGEGSQAFVDRLAPTVLAMFDATSRPGSPSPPAVAAPPASPTRSR